MAHYPTRGSLKSYPGPLAVAKPILGANRVSASYEKGVTASSCSQWRRNLKGRFFRVSAIFCHSASDAIADVELAVQIMAMGKRSGVPHRDDELDKLSSEELRSELARSINRLKIAPSATSVKQWKKRIHWLERALANRA